MTKNIHCKIDKKFLKITKILLIVGVALTFGSQLVMQSLYGDKKISNDPFDTITSITFALLFMSGIGILFISIPFIVRAFLKNNVVLILMIPIMMTLVFPFVYWIMYIPWGKILVM